MKEPFYSLRIKNERDIVAARQRARRIAGFLGFDAQDQTRIATAVSELTRNAFCYADGGAIHFVVENGSRDAGPSLAIYVTDDGPGIERPDAILAGQYQSDTGMGLGLIGAKRLADSFDFETSPGSGTAIRIGKVLPRGANASSGRLAEIGDILARERPQDASEEVQHQNREILRGLEELRRREEDLTRLSIEIENTNRGVMALYAELDERAMQLRHADELKTRFLSNVSHEFRTPLNSIRALSRLLLDRIDGDLTPEQERQVTYIRGAAEQLAELVDDLLDLAKVEAGKIEVRPSDFSVAELFGALRGMLGPLLVNDDVSLVFDDPAGLPPLMTDQGKVAQILRNFLSNALKFTEKGWVRVGACAIDGGGAMQFSVADTGVGIAPDDQGRIFDEFVQLENRRQPGTKGTGLGLPLSKRLAELLGGRVSVSSAPDQGSVFALEIPRIHGTRLASGGAPSHADASSSMDGERILIIDDNEVERYTLRQLLPSGAYRVTEAASGAKGLELAQQVHPDVLFLDLVMPEMSGFEVLDKLKTDPRTSDIPVIVFSSRHLSRDDEARLSCASSFLPKSDLSRKSVVGAIEQAKAAGKAHARNA